MESSDPNKTPNFQNSLDEKTLSKNEGSSNVSNSPGETQSGKRDVFASGECAMNAEVASSTVTSLSKVTEKMSTQPQARVLSAPIAVPITEGPNQGMFKVFISPSQHSPMDFSLFVGTPEGNEPVGNDGKFLISNSPNKPGLIYNFKDKQQQILFDLAVVHECNLDKKFLIDPKHEPPKNLFDILCEKIDACFWERLEIQLNEDPPILDEALKLVGDIKQGLNSVLLPWHNRIREEIAEALDEDLIKQQAENGAFDFNKCASYIISLMAKLCAPVRDDGIAELRKVEGIVNSFKGIFEMLNHMRIDMINYHLIAMRTELLRNGRKYEQDKFKEFMRVSGSDLPLTKNWLKKYSHLLRETTQLNVIKKAFLEFLSWDDKMLSELPEPLCHDGHRFTEMSEEYFSIIFIATLVTVTFGHLRDLSSNETFRTSLKDNLVVLLNGIKNDHQVERVMPNVTEQIVKLIKDERKSRVVSTDFSNEEKTTLTNHLCDVNPNHPVRLLMKERIDEALINILNSPTGKVSLNPSLQFLSNEVFSLGQKLSLIVSHSIAVYGEYFYKCLESMVDEIQFEN